jgi:CHAD domain-containing protein
MSFELGRREPVNDGIKRIVAERINSCLKIIQNNGNSLDETVHKLRRQLKEIRAVLRLVRIELGGNLFRQENAIFRNATRPLSELRDSTVMIKTLDQLLQHNSSKVRPETFKSLRESLCQRKLRIHRHVLVQQNTIGRVEVILRDALTRIKKWPIRQNGWEAIESGLTRSYEQSRAAMMEVLQKESDEALHEWRKRVKYQRHHFEIIRNSRKRIMQRFAFQAHTLTDLLGDHHDLAVLKGLINGELSDSLEEKESETLLSLIIERQKKLQEKAVRMGRQLCAEEGKEFISRLHGYWMAWR